MKQDLLQAALLRLQGSVLETFEAIKNAYAAPAKEGAADEIASLALRLAQLEGGLITLQQYSKQIVETAQQEATQTALAAARQALAEAKSASGGPSEVITEDNSKTMKRVRKVQKEQKKPRKEAKDNKE
jgi:hypothetical protein